MNHKRESKPSVAPGNEDELENKASKEDIEKGNFTKVVTLSYDEVDPS